MSEWWAIIGKPFAEAVVSLDLERIQAAFLNLPHSYYDYICGIYRRSPEHVIIETFLIVFVIYITFCKKDRPKQERVQLTEKEVQELCDEWTPEAIVPPQRSDSAGQLDAYKQFGIVEGNPTTHIRLVDSDERLLNLGTFDFLGLGFRPELKEVAVNTLTKYGCGSCGPRGFYGTIDVHETVEKDIADFMGTPHAITLSDSEATFTSVLPAFAKRGDLVVLDDGCQDAILTGVYLARCTVLYYNHNDLKDLERILGSIREEDKKAGRKSDCQRRYVVTEALFRNHGDIIDLPTICTICDKYFFRLFLDESFSFGVLGATGRGITEHSNMPISSVEIICASLSGAAASVGGFSTGSWEVVEYQRLNNTGYVFSASAPPFTAACCSEAIRIMRQEPELIENLRANSLFVHEKLEHLCKHFTSPSFAFSPIMHFRVKPSLLSDLEKLEKRRICRRICDRVMQKCMERGIAICSPRYKTGQLHEPLPSVRITVTAVHTIQQLENACTIIAEECNEAASDVLSSLAL
uniref:serine C-palmitoyltransferase n=1 Tax=Albugo laibachii Nc14 TaxID=890382 RepID=F0WXU4_9STRA|nr:serine palmitoyltransferase putative [Albugo laibachii Nc14]|eukprot:CCA26292.1 serine palmitoyltransferase putative [Albugo laibachii Nc14]